MTPEDKPNLSQGERTIDAVRRIAAQYQVNERTARRYWNRGELPPPPEARRQGGDGKRYPANPRRPCYLSPLRRPLAQARSCLRRAAAADTFRDGDLDLVREIVRDARRLVDQWEAVTRADKLHLTEKGDA